MLKGTLTAHGLVTMELLDVVACCHELAELVVLVVVCFAACLNLFLDECNVVYFGFALLVNNLVYHVCIRCELYCCILALWSVVYSFLCLYIEEQTYSVEVLCAEPE